MAKEKMTLTPHPNKILVKITKANWNSLFSKYIKTSDGKEVELFTDIQEEQGYEKQFQQNVSIGKIIGTGENVTGIKPGDMAIIDYLVTTSGDSLVGYINGDMIVCITAETTYHKEDSPPNMNGRNAYVVDDYEEISLLYGVVRDKKLIPRDPYVFLVYENPNKLTVSKQGLMTEEVERICARKVLASHDKSICKEGQKIIVKEFDLFERTIDSKILSVVFEQDLIAVI